MTKLSQRLDVRQSQNLVMTPQLQQAIKLLQMNNIELNEYIEEELAQNPLLEKVDPGDENGSDASESDSAAAVERDTIEDNFDEVWTGNEGAQAAPADFDPGSSMATVGAGGGSRFEDPEFSLENTLSVTKTLREHLLDQLYEEFSDSRDRLIGGQLVDQLDEAGYLRDDTAELAERLGCPADRMQDILNRMKRFDPPGIFACDLAECLALQLEERGDLDAPMRALLKNLPMLGNHDYDGLARACGVDRATVQELVAEIRTLNPRPAANFDHFVVQTVVPDVLMKALPKDIGGGWRVELNSETLPRVLINQTYYTEVAQKSRGDKEKQYLNTQMNAASWLVRAMDQRAQTILKVAAELVEQQDAFFLFGIEFLKPMTLKDIAEKIDMHESTVSRVTTNKYIGTPRGIFELKYFFTTAITSADGSVYSAETVKARIKTMIDAETADAVLSDDAIVELLQKEGMDIARRTVAKYREGMNIPSSVQRRRQKKNN